MREATSGKLVASDVLFSPERTMRLGNCMVRLSALTVKLRADGVPTPEVQFYAGIGLGLFGILVSLIGVAATLATASIPRSIEAKACFWASAVIVGSGAVLWGAQMSNKTMSLAVTFVVCGTAGVGLVLALKWVNSTRAASTATAIENARQQPEKSSDESATDSINIAGNVNQSSIGANSPNVVGNNNQFNFGDLPRSLTEKQAQEIFAAIGHIPPSFLDVKFCQPIERSFKDDMDRFFYLLSTKWPMGNAGNVTDIGSMRFGIWVLCKDRNNPPLPAVALADGLRRLAKLETTLWDDSSLGDSELRIEIHKTQ
jgi:hypothetical protein